MLKPNLQQNRSAGSSRTLVQRLGYDALRVACRTIGVWLYDLRVEGREHWPSTGGGLVCSNHQSMFDPPLVGLTCARRMNYLARDTLFRVPGLSQLIAFLDAIPIDREGGGLAGLKETLRRLKAGELVLIFPEGTRTHDGDLGTLKPGFISVARRSQVPLIPVGIDGAYQAWPRRVALPRLGRISIVVGEPIGADSVSELGDEQLFSELWRRISDCHQRARAIRGSGS
jgi:1-acyl-sn-glycerol-3-phosphate acyltransferase